MALHRRPRPPRPFAEAIDKLIAAAREGGLSDVKMMVVLEDAVERLDEGLSAA
jgi:hypothetical protein